MRRLDLNTFRSLRSTFGRFMAIFAIAAISCAFYAGVKACAPLLKESAWEHCRTTSLADMKLVSTLGFSDDNVAQVRDTESIARAYGGYSADLFAEGRRGQAIVHVMSYDKNYGMNIPYLINGRMPESSGEIIFDSFVTEDFAVNVGDTISFEGTDIEDKLARTEFTVVGTVQSSLYCKTDRGHTNIGSGSVAAFAFILPEDFSYEAYTEIYAAVKGTENCTAFGDDYRALTDNAKLSLEANKSSILETRRGELMEDIMEELADPIAEIAEGQEELDKNRADYDRAKQEFDDNEADLKEQDKLLANAGKEIEEQLEKLNQSVESISMLQATCVTVDSIITGYENTFAPSLPTDILDILTEVQQIYDDNNVEANIKDILAIYVITDPTLKPEVKEEAKQNAIAVNEQVKAASASTLTQLRTQIAAVTAQAENPGMSAELLEAGKQELEAARKELEDAKKKLDDAQAELDDARAEIDEELTKAEDELADGKIYVTRRTEWDPDCFSYGEDCDRVDSIAAAFPIFFVLLAALVCWATMTRLVESKRSEAGTLKALGYSGGQIIMQYVLYGAAASILGSVAGLAVGFKLIPRIVYICYRTMYNYPDFTDSYDLKLGITCAVCALLCNVLAVLFTAAKELSGIPAELIRPKTPRAGKRIFLEKIGFLWKRLPFLSKVSMRNLLRYKSRFFVSLIGVAGCAALLLTAFGLRYGIAEVLPRQFDVINNYSGVITLEEELDDEGVQSAITAAEDIPEITRAAAVVQEVKSVRTTGKNYDAYIMAADSVPEYVNIMPADGSAKVDFNTLAVGECIITEKLALLLNVKKGDAISAEGTDKSLIVRQVVKQHINHYVYMNKASYTAVFGDYEPNTVLFDTESLPDRERRIAITSKLIEDDNILSALFMNDGVAGFYALIDSLNAVVLLIIGFSAALTLVIMLNLADINISERTRELASIKVLGFFDGELAAYVHRETFISSILGVALGLVGGIFFENFVIVTAETDSVMFMRDLAPWCFGAAAAIMAVFILFVNIIIFIRLKGIDMASSMKAVE